MSSGSTLSVSAAGIRATIRSPALGVWDGLTGAPLTVTAPSAISFLMNVRE